MRATMRVLLASCRLLRDTLIPLAVMVSALTVWSMAVTRLV